MDEEECPARDDKTHCEHWWDGPPENGEVPYGDPGDGLGVQGICCSCGAGG